MIFLSSECPRLVPVTQTVGENDLKRDMISLSLWISEHAILLSLNNFRLSPWARQRVGPFTDLMTGRMASAPPRSPAAKSILWIISASWVGSWNHKSWQLPKERGRYAIYQAAICTKLIAATLPSIVSQQPGTHQDDSSCWLDILMSWKGMNLMERSGDSGTYAEDAVVSCIPD